MIDMQNYATDQSAIAATVIFFSKKKEKRRRWNIFHAPTKKQKKSQWRSWAIPPGTID